jgi:hypothetical protein
VIVKLFEAPVQPLADGVTTMFDTVGALELFSAVKDGIFPEPEPASPVVVLLFVQANAVPVTVPVKITAVVGDPLQTAWLDTAAALGEGFTVMEKLFEAPVQPFADGVTVMFADVAALVPFSAVKDGIFPAPEPARPMLVLLLVHVKVVPFTVPV